MNFNMNIPGLKEVTIEKIEEIGDRTCLYVSMPRKSHTCSACGKRRRVSMIIGCKKSSI